MAGGQECGLRFEEFFEINYGQGPQELYRKYPWQRPLEVAALDSQFPAFWDQKEGAGWVPLSSNLVLDATHQVDPYLKKGVGTFAYFVFWDD